MHVVVICVSPTITENPKIVTKMKEMIAVIQSYDMQPVIVVTHGDEIKPENKSIVKEKLSSFLGNDIYFVTNYTNEATKSFEHDKKNLCILHEIIKRGNDYIETHLT